MVVTRSQAVTRGIRVEVRAQLSPEHSDLEEGRWFFLYTITIENFGRQKVQLRARHWEITDGNGQVEHVRGPGVVGKEPELEPQQSFEYTSGCPLPTPFGFMKGEYEMEVCATGERFAVEVAGFPLRARDEALN